MTRIWEWDLVSLPLYTVLFPSPLLTMPFTAVTSANRTIVGSIFTAIFLAILNNKLSGELQKHLVPQVLQAGLPAKSIPTLLTAVSTGTQSALEAVPGMTSKILAVANAGASTSFAAAYAYVYYTAVALGIVSCLAALSTRDFDQYLTNHVSRQIYHKKETKEDILDLITKTQVQPQAEGIEMA